MPRLFSDTHQLENLRARLDWMLCPPVEFKNSVPLLPKSPAQSTQVKSRWSKYRLLQFLFAWRQRNYSIQCLIQSIPGVRDVFNLIWALLTIQGRLYQLRLQIEKLQITLNQTNQQWDQKYQQTKQQWDQQYQHQQREIDDFNQRYRKEHAQVVFNQSFVRRELELLHDNLSDLQKTFAGQIKTPVAEHVFASRDVWYLQFEAEYRGNIQEIQNRLQIYLPQVQTIISDPTDAIILDLGCGRGDWLAVLQTNGYRAIGVDHNTQAIMQARQAGFAVHQTDLLDYLIKSEQQSIAVITAFQVVEHLKLDILLSLLTEAKRVLRPGGLLILETPNPENLQVSGYSFWLDPTHQRPLPPPLLLQLAAYCGFCDLRIERLHPWLDPTSEKIEQIERIEQIEKIRESVQINDYVKRLLFCEQDYALLARVSFN